MVFLNILHRLKGLTINHQGRPTSYSTYLSQSEYASCPAATHIFCEVYANCHSSQREFTATALIFWNQTYERPTNVVLETDLIYRSLAGTAVAGVSCFIDHYYTSFGQLGQLATSLASFVKHIPVFVDRKLDIIWTTRIVNHHRRFYQRQSDSTKDSQIPSKTANSI